jgi:homocysteine S-methyltransferase
VRTRESLNLRAVRVLDGGFATELERRGVSVAGPLWSARALEEAPDAVKAVHRSYLEAGAEVLLTGSYQVSAMGFAAAGLAGPGSQVAKALAADHMAVAALRRAVALAVEARAEHCSAGGGAGVLVAASLGPYGAALANGAEFHGEYGFADEAAERSALVRFHAERIAALVETDADLLAFETVPSLVEARAIVEALARWPEVAAWISFTCRDGARIAHGELLRACCTELDGAGQVLAVGVNCTVPVLVHSLLGEMRAGTGKALVVYPNSGEGWDAVGRCWLPDGGISGGAAYGELARGWFAAGAQLVGGCCRTGPDEVRAVAEAAQEILDA